MRDRPIFSVLGEFLLFFLPKSCKISHFFDQNCKNFAETVCK